jgi:hypothetical protein
MKQMLRQKVREVLALQAGYGKTEEFVYQAVNNLCGGGQSLQDIRNAVEWNHAEALIRSAKDDEAEETLWFITPAGLAKQAIR